MLEADIVAGTLSGSGRQQFLDHVVREDVVFDTAIIDEAAQTTEPSTLIPLKFGCRRLVLVGDPRQLPATVLSRKAERAGLGLSLFERLERANHEVVMLTIQYRMHPGLFL
jgi:senataxin